MKKITEKIETLKNKIEAIFRLQRILIFKIKKAIFGSLETANLLEKLERARAFEEKLFFDLARLEKKIVF